MGISVASIKTSLAEWRENSPWWNAAVALGGPIGGLYFLNANLPAEIAIKINDPQAISISLNIIVNVYFYSVAIFFRIQLGIEKKLRSIEHDYEYDKRGTLYNGGQPNIAFRITTFKGILEGISKSLGAAELKAAMVETGLAASVDFASSLEEIYNKDVVRRRGGAQWSQLSISEKLGQWADYDSATGWGIMTCKIKRNEVRVIVNHLEGLFKDEGGQLFGHFLEGYCETMISAIVKTHSEGIYDDYSRCQIASTDQSDENKLELEYKLT